MENKLTVVIITFNEEKNIEEAILSASFASEVIVLDSGSTDSTCKLVKLNGGKLFHQDWLGFGPQKNCAIDLATNDWVFVLDADERFTPELQTEILSLLKNPRCDGYFVARLNKFFGKYIKFCGLYPDYSIRLFNRKKARYSNSQVHESVQLQGKSKNLKNHLLHFAYDSTYEFIEKQKKYASLSQKQKNIFKACLSPIWVFIKIYFLRLGFLDGWRGLVISITYARYTFWKYKK